MKALTREILDKELLSGGYVYTKNPKAIQQLFEKYLEIEIDSKEELFKAFRLEKCVDSDFFKYVIQNMDSFEVSSKVLEREEVESVSKLLGDEAVKQIRRMFVPCFEHIVKDQQKFVNIVNEVLSYASILDVGSSASLPLSSLLFTELCNNVSSMDQFSHEWMSTKFLEKLHLDIRDGYFNNNTDITQFDAVVGNSPCSAIIPMVDKCANDEHSEYFIRICSCCSPRNGVAGFVQYLKEKDRNLKAIVSRTNYKDNVNNCFVARNDDIFNDLDIVYVTNSHKHEDDIIDVVGRAHHVEMN